MEFLVDGQRFDSAQMIVIHTPEPLALCVLASRDYRDVFIVGIEPQTGVSVRRTSVKELQRLASAHQLPDLLSLAAKLRAHHP